MHDCQGIVYYVYIALQSIRAVQDPFFVIGFFPANLLSALISIIQSCEFNKATVVRPEYLSID